MESHHVCGSSNPLADFTAGKESHLALKKTSAYNIAGKGEIANFILRNPEIPLSILRIIRIDNGNGVI